jgi:hypothetical protein
MPPLSNMQPQAMPWDSQYSAEIYQRVTGISSLNVLSEYVVRMCDLQ